MSSAGLNALGSGIDPQRLALSQQGRAYVEAQLQAERQAEIQQQLLQQEKARAAARATRRDPNVVFIEGKGWDYLVKPTYESVLNYTATGSTMPDIFTIKDVNQDYLKQNPNSDFTKSINDQVAKQNAANKAAADAVLEKAENQAIFDLAAKGIYDSVIDREKGTITYTDPAKVQEAQNKAAYEAANARLENYLSNQQSVKPGDLFSLEGFKAQNKTGQEYAGYISKGYTPRFNKDGSIIFTKSEQNTSSNDGAPDFGIATPKSGRPGVFESVGPYGMIETTIISRPEPGKQYEYFTPDPTNPWNIQKREVQPDVIAQDTGFIKPPNDFFAGVRNTFENIIEPVKAGFVSITTGKPYSPDYKPELESNTYQAIGSGQQYLTVKGVPLGGSVLFTPQTFKNLAEVGQQAKDAPLYFAGSALVSIGLSAGSAGIAPAARTISRVGGAIFRIGRAAEVTGEAAKPAIFSIKSIPGVIRTTREAQKAGEIATAAAKMTDVEPTAIRPIKVAKEGSYIALNKNPLGFYTETKQVSAPVVAYSNFSIPIPGTSASMRVPYLAIGKRSIEVPAATKLFAIEQESEDVGLVSTKTGKTTIIAEEPSPAQKEYLVGQKVIPAKPFPAVIPAEAGAPVKATNITDVYQNEAKVFQKTKGMFVEHTTDNDVIDIPIVASGKTGAKIAESQRTGASLISYSNKDLLTFVKGEKREAKLQAAASKKLGEIPKPKKQKTAFDFTVKAGPAPKTSKTPLETIKIYKSDREFAEAAKKAAVIEVTMPAATKTARSEIKAPIVLIGPSSKIGLGGNASQYTPKEGIGFKGETGAGRKARKLALTNQDIEIVSLTTPATSPISKQANKINVNLSTRGILENNQRARERTAASFSTNILPKVGTIGSTKNNLSIRSTSGQAAQVRLSTDLAPKLNTSERQAMRTATAQRLKLDFDKPSKTIKLPNYTISVKPKERSKKRGSFGAAATIGLGLRNILAPGFSILPEGKKRKRGLTSGIF